METAVLKIVMNDKNENENCCSHFHAELKSGFQSLTSHHDFVYCSIQNLTQLLMF